MLYVTGVYHPLPGKHPMPEGYALTAEEVRSMSVTRLPVTVEHIGIHEAVHALYEVNSPLTPETIGAALEMLHAEGAEPVGVVMRSAEGKDGRFYALLALDNDAHPALALLIKSGALRGLSLTHRVGSPHVALEISLCSRPARPECYIVAMSQVPTEQYAYFRKLINLPAMTDAAPTSPTPLQKIIDGLGEDDRKLVTARFTDLLKAVDEKQAALDVAETSLKAANEKISEQAKIPQNDKLLEQQLHMLMEQVNPSLKDTYFLTPEAVLADISSDDAATVRAATDRLIMACNRQMMDDRAKSIAQPEPRTTPAPKRKAEDEAPETQEEDILKRALQEQFSW